MQNIIKDGFSEKKNKAVFTHESISDVLFLNKPPLYTFFPFHKLQNFSNRRTSITLKVKLFDSNSDPIEIFTDIIDQIGTIKVTSANQIPSWFASKILSEYKIISSEWFSFLSKELRVYCDENLNSKVQWASFIHNIPIFNFPLSFEQKLWIHANSNRDIFKQQEFLINLKESVIPWLNPKLYSEVKKKEENTKKNENYEKQKREMFESNNTEKISELISNNEDLDEVS